MTKDKSKTLYDILGDAVKRGEIPYYDGYIIGDDEGWDDVPFEVIDEAFKRLCDFGVDVRMVKVLMLQGMGVTPQNIGRFAKDGDFLSADEL